jgi:peptidoglycan/LPS O-acetylase OafA/YrhL
MGILRIYLAICVVLGHSDSSLSSAIHNSREAVQIFFLISGFYMAFVFGKYQRLSEFYFSRFIRIFVPYWTIGMAVVIFSIIGGLVFGNWGELSPYFDFSDKNGLAGVLFVTVSNVTIFFQDAVLFLSQDAGETFSFTPNFWNSRYPLYHYLIIPQAWTIGIELVFYLCVPFLVKLKTKKLVGVVLLSLSARIFCYEVVGWSGDPWVYRFFPFEIALFGTGMLSCHIWRKNKTLFDRVLGAYSNPGPLQYLVQILGMLFLFYISATATDYVSEYIGTNYSELLSYLAWAAMLPVFFSMSRKNKSDRFIGELSYPVYLVHFFILYVISEIQVSIGPTFPEIEAQIAGLEGVVVSVISVLVAIVVVKLVISPLDKNRYALAKKMANKATHFTKPDDNS